MRQKGFFKKNGRKSAYIDTQYAEKNKARFWSLIFKNYQKSLRKKGKYFENHKFYKKRRKL